MSNQTYPRELIKFIRSVQVDPKGIVIENVLDKESDYVSRMYTPNRRVSKLGAFVAENLALENIRVNENDLDELSFIPLVKKSKVLESYPFLQKHFRLILLESFSISFAMGDQTELLKYMDKEDLGKVRETIKYTLDIMGPDVRYTPLILSLQELELAIGYIQAQTDVIKRGEGIEV